MRDFEISFNGEKMLYLQQERWLIAPVAAPRPGEGVLRVENMEVRIEPREEWKQVPGGLEDPA